MKRSSKIRIGVILAVGLALMAAGRVADRWMLAQGGDSIAGNVYMLVLVATVGLVGAVFRTDRNRDVAVADAGMRAQALSLAPRPGQAQVVVFRDDRMGARLGADLRVDDRLHTHLTSPGFTLVDLAPGPHRIVLEWEGQRVEHTLDLKAGDVQALHVKMRLGLSTAHASLVPVPAERARQMIGSAPMALPVTG